MNKGATRYITRGAAKNRATQYEILMFDTDSIINVKMASKALVQIFKDQE